MSHEFVPFARGADLVGPLHLVTTAPRNVALLCVQVALELPPIYLGLVQLNGKGYEFLGCHEILVGFRVQSCRTTKVAKSDGYICLWKNKKLKKKKKLPTIHIIHISPAKGVHMAQVGRQHLSPDPTASLG